VVRFAMPLFSDGRLRGLLVLNYRARRLIDAVRTEVDSPMSRAMLLNAQGYWLAAPDPADEWGFMLENGRTMELRHPELWTAMRREQRGRLQDSSGLYLYRTVYPLDMAPAGAPLPQSGTARKAPGGYSWILASWISPEAFEARYSALRRDVGLLFLAALGLVLPLAAYAALARARQRKAKRDRRLASRVFEATGDAVLVTDSQFRIIRANAAFTTLTGWESAQIAGQEPEAMFSPSRTPAGMGARIRAQLASGGWQGVLWFRRAGSGEVPAWASVSQVVDARGLLRNCVLVLNDMTERMREEERVRILAERDALTGLPNRRVLDDRLEQAVARARRGGTRLAVLFIDLDRLKRVNDEGGHDAGDAVLQATARRLTATLRASDTAARRGGDEFVVLLDGVADRAVAQAVADKLELAIEQPTEVAGRHYLIGARIGVRLFPEDGDTASALLHAADEEMYSAKARHRLDGAPAVA
jgi:diguanylate cyclase (GGDEF)-like protein/PAS domain S-box-containing protein